MNDYYDLHTHLYGCLSLEDLRWLAHRNSPRWPIFVSSWENVYGHKPDINDLFEDSEKSTQKLASYYFPKLPGDFKKFQASFDLIIALSTTDESELTEIVQRVMDREKARYAEYKMMFSPFEKGPSYQSKLKALCHAMHQHQTKTKQSRLIMSISRDTQPGLQHYEWIRDSQASDPVVAKMLVGLDFCSTEEGYPPTQNTILQKILADNKQNPTRALIVTYHVGESFIDKSVETTIRWIWQAAQYGCHRLGHALALGIPAEFFGGSRRSEKKVEFMQTLEWIKGQLDGLQKLGYKKSAQAIDLEIQKLQQSSTDEVVIDYNDEQVQNLHILQNQVMHQIANSKVVIESCPTSNLYVGNLGDLSKHPLKRFLEAGIHVIIGSDDPGIFQTDIVNEFRLLETSNLFQPSQIDQLRTHARDARAEVLLGR